MSDQTVVLLGELSASDGPVADIVYSSGATPVGVADWRTASELLRGGNVIAVVFSATMEGFEELCVELRSDPSFGDLPLLAVAPSPRDPLLERLFMFGIDDYVTDHTLDALESKIRALASGNPWVNLAPESGKVIVANPDRSRRVLYGRLLRRRGLGIDFAADGDEVARLVERSDSVRLILASADLPPDGAAAAIVGGVGGDLPWIIGGTLEQLEAVNSITTSEVPMRLFTGDDPPESVLFLLNDLLAPPPSNVRRSPRLLHGAPATFRVIGSDQLVPAFTYNINKTGVFIRTLVPPPRDSELVLDFRPPYGEGHVRAHGRVVWRKECSQQGGPVVPAGMGVIYTRLPLADGAALEAGYAALLSAAPGQRSTRVDGLKPSSDEVNGDKQG